MGWRKITGIIVAFLLVTLPGAVDAWLGLTDRLRGKEEPLIVNFGSWSDVYQLIFPLFGLAILVGVVIWWPKRGAQISSGEPAAPRSEETAPPPNSLEPTETSGINKAVFAEPKDEHNERDSILRTMMVDDLENIQRCYRIRQDMVDWKNLETEIGSRYVDFRFLLTSSAVWTTKVGEIPRGKLRYIFTASDTPGTIRQVPELVLSDQVQNLRRTFDGVFTIRQYLPLEVLVDLYNRHGQEIIFLFDDIQLPLSLHGDIVEQQQSKWLRLPNDWKIKVPPFGLTL